MGEGFPKLIYHSIICIGALVAERVAEGWSVKAVGAPHVGERPEKTLIESFVRKIEETNPQMVTFNGCSFDLPVLRYRAMIHNISAPGLSSRQYYHRYTEDAVDLCDVLSSFSHGAKSTLQELSLIMGLPGKSGWDFRGPMLRPIIIPAGSKRSPNIVRPMWSTPINSGFDMNCSEGS